MPALSKKVCLLGDFAVGKTSLVRRFVHDYFDDQYLSTIGVKVSRKTINIAQGEQIVELTMMLWDLAGSEEFTHLRASYLRGAAGVLLVGDLTRPLTFDTLPLRGRCGSGGFAPAAGAGGQQDRLARRQQQRAPRVEPGSGHRPDVGGPAVPDQRSDGRRGRKDISPSGTDDT